MRCTGGEVRLIDLIRALGSERDAKVLHFVVVSAFVSDRKPSRAEGKKEHMLNMKFRPKLLLVIVLLASAGLTEPESI